MESHNVIVGLEVLLVAECKLEYTASVEVAVLPLHLNVVVTLIVVLCRRCELYLVLAVRVALLLIVVDTVEDVLGVISLVDELLDIEVISCLEVALKARRINGSVVNNDLELNAACLLLILSACCVDTYGKRISVFVYLIVAALAFLDISKSGIDVVFLFEFLALCTVEVVKTCKVAAEACVIVVSNFVVDVVLCFVNVEVLEVRTAYESAPEGVYLMIGSSMLCLAEQCDERW